MRQSRAFTLSVTALLLGLFLLATAISIRDNVNLQNENLKEFASMEKMQIKYENISDNVIELIQKTAGLDWSVQNNEVTFTETLPSKEQRTQFGLDIETYEKFVQQNKGGLDVNLNFSQLSLETINIQPFDVNYGHRQQGDKKVGLDNVAEFQPSEINFDGYDIEIILKNQSYQDLIVDANICDGCPKPVYLDINIVNSNKIGEAERLENNLDPNKITTVTVQTAGSAENDVIITLGPNGVLAIQNNNSVAIDLEAGIDFNSSIEAPFIGVMNQGIQVADQFGQRKT